MQTFIFLAQLHKEHIQIPAELTELLSGIQA